MSCRSRILKCCGLLAVAALLLITAPPVSAQSVTTGMPSPGSSSISRTPCSRVSDVAAVHQPTGTEYTGGD